MYRFYYISIPVLFFLTSCCAGRKAQKGVVVRKDTTSTIPVVTTNSPKEDSIAFIKAKMKAIQNATISYTTFAAKIDLDITEDDGKKRDANAHIRMYKDSLLWVSVTGPFGIEGVRAIITKDSVKLINKQEKTYLFRSVSYLQDLTSLPLDLTSIQNLLIGNPVFLDSNITSYTKDGDNINLMSDGMFFSNLFTINAIDNLPRYSKLTDTNPEQKRSCNLFYDDYELKEGVTFSTRRLVEVVDKKKLSVKMRYKQYSFNETLSFPFSISKNYKEE
jgi:hypothetical protein